jgi:predicted nucleic acid-binding protein
VTLYVDSSALIKRYVDEHDSDAAVELMTTDPVLLTSRITEVEVRRNLSRLLDAPPLDAARRQFSVDLDAFALMSVDAVICNDAARIAEQTLCRSLDALHVASALRAGAATVLLTFDIRQARTARAVGLSVVGC